MSTKAVKSSSHGFLKRCAMDGQVNDALRQICAGCANDVRKLAGKI